MNAGGSAGCGDSAAFDALKWIDFVVIAGLDTDVGTVSCHVEGFAYGVVGVRGGTIFNTRIIRPIDVEADGDARAPQPAAEGGSGEMVRVLPDKFTDLRVDRAVV